MRLVEPGEAAQIRYTAPTACLPGYHASSTPYESIDLVPGSAGVFSILVGIDDGAVAVKGVERLDAARARPVGGEDRAEKRSLLRMEFSTFCVAMIQVPCQVVRTAGRIAYRLLSWNPWQGVFLRLVERHHGRRIC